MAEPKILLFDIETAPIILYAWALGQEVWDPKFIRRNWFILCWSAKWLGKKKIYHSKLPDFRGYKELPSKTERHIDKEVIQGLWDLLDSCDAAIAHNIKSFDRKKANTRFIINGMEPPSPYHVIDTLTEARKEFKFTSNKLEYLGDKLCVEKKMSSGGWDTWLGIEGGNKKDWTLMQKYCDQDVRSLEEVYLVERPYMRHHPNFSIITGDKGHCIKCKGEVEVTKDGKRYSNSGVFQKLRCKSCGSPLKGKQLKDGTQKITNG